MGSCDGRNGARLGRGEIEHHVHTREREEIEYTHFHFRFASFDDAFDAGRRFATFASDLFEASPSHHTTFGHALLVSEHSLHSVLTPPTFVHALSRRSPRPGLQPVTTSRGLQLSSPLASPHLVSSLVPPPATSATSGSTNYMTSLPTSMKALTLHKTPGNDWKPGKVYHPTKLSHIPIPVPNEDQVLVKVLAAAFNHRDLFQRQSRPPPHTLACSCVRPTLSFAVADPRSTRQVSTPVQSSAKKTHHQS